MMNRIYKCVSIAVMVALGASASGQANVGIGTTSPDATAALHIVSPGGNQGVLIPVMDQAMRVTVKNNHAADGLLVYDPGLRKFFFFDGTAHIWRTLNPLTAPNDDGSAQHSGNLDVSGMVTATNYGINLVGNGPVPRGGIIMWSGVFGSVPDGWQLCDGTNSTPNLSDRFIVSNGPTYSIGDQGGTDNVTLTVNQMPSHTHTILGQSGGDNNDNNNEQRFAGGDKGVTENAFFFQTESQPKGQDQPFDNRPRYYALAFIMKL